ncbi:MAG: RsiV family protein [Treponema sp.]|nr:RsiV family protein [Treponema sp.]
MKKHSICVIVLAACLLAGSCVSSPKSAAEFTPFVLEKAIPFDRKTPQNPRFEINISLPEPAKPISGLGNLIRDLLYEGQSAADYGNGVAAELGKLYAEIRDEWESLGERPMESFNWHYTEKVESRTVSVDGLIPGHEKLLVFAKTTESYLGGAHGNLSTSCFVVDQAAVKRLALNDIFDDTEKLRLLLEAELRRHYGLPENAPLSEAGFFEDRVELPENFFLTEGDSGGPAEDSPFIHFLWNAYETAPYVMGAIEISMPLRSLSPLFLK